MTWVEFDEHALRALRASDLSRPVGMLNLLKFRDVALFAPDRTGPAMSGEAAYRRYGAALTKAFGHIGFKLVMAGTLGLIGPADEWDETFIVSYPSCRSFVDMIDSSEYHDIMYLRQAALSDSRLFVLQTPTRS